MSAMARPLFMKTEPSCLEVVATLDMQCPWQVTPPCSMRDNSAGYFWVQERGSGHASAPTPPGQCNDSYDGGELGERHGYNIMDSFVKKNGIQGCRTRLCASCDHKDQGFAYR